MGDVCWCEFGGASLQRAPTGVEKLIYTDAQWNALEKLVKPHDRSVCCLWEPACCFVTPPSLYRIAGELFVLVALVLGDDHPEYGFTWKMPPTSAARAALDRTLHDCKYSIVGALAQFLRSCGLSEAIVAAASNNPGVFSPFHESNVQTAYDMRKKAGGWAAERLFRTRVDIRIGVFKQFQSWLSHCDQSALSELVQCLACYAAGVSRFDVEGTALPMEAFILLSKEGQEFVTPALQKAKRERARGKSKSASGLLRFDTGRHSSSFKRQRRDGV